MSWDTDSHTEQNDHAEGTLPMYAGTRIVGEAGNFTINGRHNAMRWHEFSNGAALLAEPIEQYTPPSDDMTITPVRGYPNRFVVPAGTYSIGPPVYTSNPAPYTVETPQDPDDGDPDDDHVELADRESGAEYISRVQAAEALYDR